MLDSSLGQLSRNLPMESRWAIDADGVFTHSRHSISNCLLVLEKVELTCD